MADMGPLISAADAYGDARAAETAGPLNARIDQLEAENARLRDQLDPPVSAGMLIGADTNMPSGLPKDNTLANFKALSVSIGPLLVRRSFPEVAGIVASAKADLAAGTIPMVSLKRGPSDAQWADVGRNLPREAYMIPHHEHEGGFARGAEFVAFYRKVAGILHGEGLTKVGPASLGYAWRAAGGVGNAGVNTGPLEPASAWDVGDDHCDFRAIDVYSQRGVPMADYPNFQNWYKAVKSSTKPLIVAEYGTVVVPHGTTATASQDQKRADLYGQDFEYFKTIGITMLLLWNGGGDNGWWAPDGPKAKAAWKAIAAAGRAV